MRVAALGYRCNNACVFCAQGDLRQRDGGRVDGAAIERTLAALRPGETIAFVGGEPTLDDRLVGWIADAVRRGAGSVVLQTNGRRLAYRAYARALAEHAPALRLDVSLQGSSEAMHDYHTQAPSSFRQTVAGIGNARASGIAVGTTTVVTRSNFRHLSEIVELARTLGVDAIHFAAAAPFGSAAREADRVIAAPEMIAPHLARAASEARRLGLGVWIEDETSPVDTRFAGRGSVETTPEVATPPPAPPVRALPVLGKPVPALRETRAAVRRSGADLKEILPELFNGVERAGAGR